MYRRLAKIVFESHRDGEGHADLFTMGIDGSNVTRLNGSSSDEIRAEFSPDGEEITYSQDSQIWVMDADGQNPAELLPDDYDHSWGSHWSPDGKKLAFTRYYGDDETHQSRWRELPAVLGLVSFEAAIP